MTIFTRNTGFMTGVEGFSTIISSPENYLETITKEIHPHTHTHTHMKKEYTIPSFYFGVTSWN